jgi:hypothetical protein
MITQIVLTEDRFGSLTVMCEGEVIGVCGGLDGEAVDGLKELEGAAPAPAMFTVPEPRFDGVLAGAFALLKGDIEVIFLGAKGTVADALGAFLRQLHTKLGKRFDGFFSGHGYSW